LEPTAKPRVNGNIPEFDIFGFLDTYSEDPEMN
jgi:hypothetical protein